MTYEHALVAETNDSKTYLLVKRTPGTFDPVGWITVAIPSHETVWTLHGAYSHNVGEYPNHPIEEIVQMIFDLAHRMPDRPGHAVSVQWPITEHGPVPLVDKDRWQWSAHRWDDVWASCAIDDATKRSLTAMNQSLSRHFGGA